jgi:hypothetical protein
MTDSESALFCSLLPDNNAIQGLDRLKSEHFKHKCVWGMLAEAKLLRTLTGRKF